MMIIGKFPDISRCFQMERKGRVSRCSRVVCILRWFGGLSVYGSWSPAYGGPPHPVDLTVSKKELGQSYPACDSGMG